MSLINDALKRAKEAQPKGLAPAAGPSLHPVAAERRSGPDILLVMLAVVIFLLAGLLLWEWFFGAGSELKVRANTFPAAAVKPAAEVEVSPPMPAPAQPVATAPESKDDVTNAPSNPTVVESPTNTPVVAAEPPKPEPIKYKLQGIFYYAKNPSAVINGKTVFVRSLVGDVQVVAIGRDSATIMMANGQTKVLDLP